MPKASKKQVLVLATSMLMTDSSGKEVVLESVSCIYYPVQFQGSQEQVKALLDNSSEVNTMSPAYVERLGFYIQKTNVGAQKIDRSVLEIFGMVITNF